MKVTVKEYSEKFAITTQAVYQKLASGKLKSVLKDGKKYVFVEEKQEQEALQKDTSKDTSSFASYLQGSLQKKDEVITSKDVEIKRLNEELIKAKEAITKAKEHENTILMQYIEESRQLRLEQKPEEIKIEPVEEAEIEEDLLAKEDRATYERLKNKRKKKKLSKDEKKLYKELRDKK